MPQGTLARVLGTASAGERGGPLVLVTVGIHGNEPAGLHAMRRVFAELERGLIPLAGRVAAYVGNRAGLARNVRYVDEDMNRLWSPARVDELRRGPVRRGPVRRGPVRRGPVRRGPVRRDTIERAEQRELLELLDAELESAESGVTHLDLHSTSGDGPPFTIVAGPAESRTAALRLGVPTLCGLEPLIAGTLIEYVGALGHAAVVLEGGQNDATSTVDHHESAVWLTLAGAGVVREHDVPGGIGQHTRRLSVAAADLPPAIEIGYVHRLEPGEAFAMLPGFRNFQTVEVGQLLAHQGLGFPREIRAPWSGILLMPRYQGQGLDGFFLGRTAPTSPADATATRLG